MTCINDRITTIKSNLCHPLRKNMLRKAINLIHTSNENNAVKIMSQYEKYLYIAVASAGCNSAETIAMANVASTNIVVLTFIARLFAIA